MSSDGRIRSVDVSKLAPERIEELSAQIGEKVGTILNNASLEINKILNIYGVQAKLIYHVEPLNLTETDKKE